MEPIVFKLKGIPIFEITYERLVSVVMLANREQKIDLLQKLQKEIEANKEDVCSNESLVKNGNV